jgi:hypothetical protein
MDNKSSIRRMLGSHMLDSHTLHSHTLDSHTPDSHMDSLCSMSSTSNPW